MVKKKRYMMVQVDQNVLASLFEKYVLTLVIHNESKVMSVKAVTISQALLQYTVSNHSNVCTQN